MKYRNCSSSRSIQQQSIFENSLLEVMSVKHYASITVTDIASQAGLSRKSFYHYFDGKDGCLQALVDHTVQNLHSRQMLNPDGSLSMVNIMCYWKEQHKLIDGLYKSGRIEILPRRILFFATEEDGFRTYVAWKGQSPAREEAVLLVGGLCTVLVDWYLSGYEKTPQDLGASLEALMARLFPDAHM